MGAGKQATRRLRRDHAALDNNEDASTMDFDDNPNHEDHDCRRRNSSSADERDEGDEDNNHQIATAGPTNDFDSLVKHAGQLIGLQGANGLSGADGASMALAVTSVTDATAALSLLAASSAMANMSAQRASSNAARAIVHSDLAAEGLRNSDCTYDNRFKRYDTELQHLKDRHVELQNRVALLEGLLSSVLSMMQRGNVDATEIAQMLQNLGI